MMNNRQAGRRGRGRNTNNRPQNNRGGGSDRENRIDNRARGNAVQMLDKFKKMAQDAQVNGDRVQAEYYHQFADHYFRVNADTVARREEQRIAREEPRGDNRGDNRSNNQDDSSDNDSDNGRNRPQRKQSSRQARDDQNDQEDRDDKKASDGAEEKKPVRSRRPRKAESVPAQDDASDKNSESNGLDASVLPPAISASNEVVVEKKPARKKRVTKPRPAEENDAA
ncbi:MAG: hypothetical protein COA41_07650 [Sphingopyxis sp.]|nr:MAG: hypothetical protein COA41_07650 [Sphingopyxis sp.]